MAADRDQASVPGAGPADLRDDIELVVAARGGDRLALDVLLRRHALLIHSICRRLTGNDHDAADAAQDAMIAIVRGIARFDDRSRFTTWAYRVTTNACLDELRRRRRRPQPVDPPDVADGGEALVEPAGPDLDAAAADRLDVDSALARLPGDFRAAVVLRDLCGLDYAEIADVLEVPIGTVRSRIARGRAALVPLLSDRAPSPARPAGNSPPLSDRQTGR